MALMDCPECKSQISDRANACPKCGFPIKEEVIQKNLSAEPILDEIHRSEILEIKSLPLNGIGGQIVNWLGDGVLKDGTIDIDENYLGSISSGKVTVYRHKKGMKLRNGLLSSIDFDINYGQIIDIKERTAEEIVHEKKSIIGRGIAGGLLLGPAAAVVGALSALNTNTLKKLSIIHFVFFDVNADETKEFYIRVKKGSASAFLMAVRKMIANSRPSYAEIEKQRTTEYFNKKHPKLAAQIERELEKNKKNN